VDEDDEIRFVAALNETAKPGVDNQLFWVLANHPQWWDLVLEADVKPIPPEGFFGRWSEFPPDPRTGNEIEIKLHSGRRIVIPYHEAVVGCWLSRDDLRDLFGADHQSGKPRESSRTTLRRLRLRGDIQVEKVNPHGWVRLPLSRKTKLQTSLRHLWNTLELTAVVWILSLLGFLYFLYWSLSEFLEMLFG
jgi:hypothetical protein